MTLLYVEGFEGFSSTGTRTALDPNYDFMTGIATGEAGLTAGRVSGKSAFTANGIGIPTNTGMLIPLLSLSTESTWIFGFAYKYTGVGEFNDGSTNRSIVLQLRDGDEAPFFTIYARASTLVARSGAHDGTKLGVASCSFLAQVWYYVEVKAVLHASAGSLVVRVHEQECLNLTNVNTDPNGSTNPAQALVAVGNIHAAGGSFQGTGRIDDLYICDGVDATATQGQPYNDFLGDNIVLRLTPNANGTTNDFDGSDGDSTDNYLMVDDPDGPDGDGPGGTHVESDTAAEKDLYGLTNLTVTPAQIEAVVLKSYARKTDGGSRTFVHVARSSSTEQDSAAIAPSTEYQFHQSIFTEDPNTGSRWLKAGVDAMEAGVKVAS